MDRGIPQTRNPRPATRLPAWLPLGLAVAAMAITACYAGCRHEPARTIVSGTVTYQGQPVDRGEIRFVPTKGSTGPVCTADIAGGRYRADFHGGVIVGTARVEVFAFRFDKQHPGHPANEEPLGGGPLVDSPPHVQYLPARYNIQSQLETTVPRQGAEVSRDFSLSE